MSTGESHLAAAYLVLFAAVLLYVVLIALKLARLERELAELARIAKEPGRWLSCSWPALLAYGEAAVAYAGNARKPGPLRRLATWGVRIGWLAQTALLAGQASRADSFPWSTWAGSLNLFVWLVVGAYLIWGCSPRFRLLGLAVMPFAAALLAVSYIAGGRTAEPPGTTFCSSHTWPSPSPPSRIHRRGGARRARALGGTAAQASSGGHSSASSPLAPRPRPLNGRDDRGLSGL